jgi:phosphoribosylformylglycinamidine synthase subunit PurL
VEACLLSGHGARVSLPAQVDQTQVDPAPLDPFVVLFSESSARVLLGVSGAGAHRVAQLCTDHGVPVTQLGEIHTAPVLEIVNVATFTLDELRAAWEGTLPALFGTASGT